jgi:catechol 2,3-dioxygenase-like lactoylglutathione lyase family enzyme
MKYFHVALSVRSINESQNFFESVFGLVFKTQGERPEIGVRFIMLEDKNSGAVIELFEHDKPIQLQEDLMDFQKAGIKHIAFIVDNIEKVIEQAKKCGGKVIWEPRKGITVKRTAFVADLNNIPIELIEL